MSEIIDEPVSLESLIPETKRSLESQTSVHPSFRFHALSLPHTVTTPEYNACAYTMKVLKFCKMMKARGHYIIHYGHKDSVVDADEHVTLLDNDDLLKAYGSYNWRKEFFKHNVNDYANTKFQEVGTVEVLKRLSGGELRNPNDTRKDFVLAFWGIGHGKICDAAKATGKAMICEPGIGYTGSFMDYRVFESYAWLHTTYGKENISRPSWYHVVIPNYFDTQEFHYSPIKSDYFLCLGRINTCKGVQIAIQAAKKLNVKLVLAGQGDIYNDLGITDIPENVIYYGYADVEARKKLMAYAKGFILLSAYIEPFGGAAVEALMSGTPVICPDWGVFNETVPHNEVGYRVRTFDQITWAMKNIDKINPANCRSWAVNNYSLEKVGKMYETYFIQLADVNESGWYQTHPERTELDWLEKNHSSDNSLEKNDSSEISETQTYNLSEISKLNIILEEKKLETILMNKEHHAKIIEVQVNHNESELLKQIFMKHNTDKFNGRPHCHTYHNKYSQMFSKLRTTPINLFEMGIGTVNPNIPSSMAGYQKLFNYQPGASLRAWSEYFSHVDTKIYGGDIDPETCNPELYTDYVKIKCGVVDQTKAESVKKLYSETFEISDLESSIPETKRSLESSEKFDIMIDDGLHNLDASITTMKASWDYLKPNGYYIIESTNLNEIDFNKYFTSQAKTLCKFEVYSEPKINGNIEDNYLTIFRKPENSEISNSEIFLNLENENFNIPQFLESKFSKIEKMEILDSEIPELPKFVKSETSKDLSVSGSEAFKDIQSPERSFKKIAIWSENSWAMGRIHNDLIKYMSKESKLFEGSYEFDYLDWNNRENTRKLVDNWESYDVIISNSTIYNSKYNFFSHLYENPKFLSKVLSVSHCPLIDHKFYGEKLDGLSPEQLQSTNLGHVSKQGIKNLKSYYKELNSSELESNPREISWLPCGVDLDNFKIKPRINFPLKNIGFIGKPDYDNNYDVKNVETFKAIVSKSGMNPVYIHSKHFTEYDKLYSDIDLLICTSSIEAGPLGIFEASACGIPVLSTKVGNVSELQSLITFETVEEAVEIIEYFNTHPKVLQEYLTKVTDEVRNNWSSEILISKYWKPVIDSLILKNIV